MKKILIIFVLLTTASLAFGQKRRLVQINADTTTRPDTLQAGLAAKAGKLYIVPYSGSTVELANILNPVFSSNITVNGYARINQGLDLGTFSNRGLISYREGENINGIRAYSGLYYSDDEYSILADNINLRTYNAATGDIIFSPSNSAKGVWKKSGNLLIGSTVDDAANKLQVTGNTKLTGNLTVTGTTTGITKSMVGLGNVDNTTDLNKPISTLTQTALNLKANILNPVFSSNITVNGSARINQGLDLGTFSNRGLISYREGENINGIRSYSGLYYSDDEYSILADNINLRTYNAATGDIIFSPSNTAKGVWKKSGNLLIGSAVDDAVNKLQVTGNTKLTGNLTVTGTTTGITKTMVGLGSVDNTSDVNKPVSTAQQTALNAKQATITGLTDNYVSKWNGAAFANSLIYDNGTNVGIGTASPSEKLDVAGNVFIGKDNNDAYLILRNISSGAFKNDFIIQGNSTYTYLGNYQNHDLSFRTNNTERLIIKGDGNVGIGTTNPVGKLGIGSGNQWFFGAIYSTTFNTGGDNNSDGDYWLNFSGYNEGFTRARSLNIGNGKGGNIAYFDGVNNRVGIGTTNPNSTLNVVTAGGNGQAMFGFAGGSASYIDYESTNFRSKAGVNIAQFGSGQVQLFKTTYFYAADGAASGYAAITPGSAATTPYLGFHKAGGTRLGYIGYDNTNMSYNAEGGANHIFNGGNVGIGTASPAHKLDVNGTTKSNYYVTDNYYNSSSYNPLIFTNNGGQDIWSQGANGVIRFVDAGYANVNFSVKQNGDGYFRGNVGIGTPSPDSKVEISGTGEQAFKITNTTNGVETVLRSLNSVNDGWVGTLTNHPFRIASNNSTAIFIDTTQNVGIGTPSPAYKLDVNGEASIYGVLIGRGGGAISTNIRVGAGVLINNTTGSHNTALGTNALNLNSTGSYSLALGASTLAANTTGNSNVGVGGWALFSNLTGSENLAIGVNAGRWHGATSALTVANQSIFLGSSSKALGDSETNQIVIGYAATGAGSNSVVLGNDNIAKTILKGNVGIGTTSPVGILDVVSTTKLAALPRMTTTQKNAITAFEGALVYDLTLHKMQVYNGTVWENLN
jgi:hypothetical protein